MGAVAGASHRREKQEPQTGEETEAVFYVRVHCLFFVFLGSCFFFSVLVFFFREVKAMWSQKYDKKIVREAYGTNKDDARIITYMAAPANLINTRP